WSNGATTSTTTGLTAGTYTVSVSDAHNCNTTATVVITQPTPMVIVPTNTNDLCNGNTNATASVTASGGVTPYTYAWSTGATTSNISGLSAGTYSVSVTDNNGAN